MSEERLPWFACYPSKLLGALAAMTPDEQLVYITTLLRIYEVGGSISDDDTALARRTGLTPKRVAAAIARLCANGKLIKTDDHRLMNPVAAEEIEEQKRRIIEASDKAKAAADARWKKDKQNQQMQDAPASSVHTESTANAVLGDAHKQEHRQEEKKDSRSVATATRPDARLKFSEFWLAYPRRDGPNPKSPAEKKFIALVSSGVDPTEIVSAAKRYAGEMRQKGQERTAFVAQAITWLNQRRWGDYGEQPEEAADPVLLPVHGCTLTEAHRCPPQFVGKVYLKAETDEFDAWAGHARTIGRPHPPTHFHGGFAFSARWPPGHPRASPAVETSAAA